MALGLLVVGAVEDEVGAQLAVIGEESEAAASGDGGSGAGSGEAATPEVREEEKQDSGDGADAPPAEGSGGGSDQGSAEAGAQEQPVPVEQADEPAEAPSPDCIDGRATLTMLTSSSAMKIAPRQTTSARQRMGFWPSACSPSGLVRALVWGSEVVLTATIVRHGRGPGRSGEDGPGEPGVLSPRRGPCRR